MSDPQQRLMQAVDRYLESVEAGQPIPPERLLAEYADVREELGDCLSTLAFIHRAAAEPAAASSAEICEEQFAATEDPLLQTVLGDYRLRKRIGRGGMGVVYEAEQLTLQRRVAVKVLPFAAALDDRRLQRFRHEAMSAAALHHPHIVPVFLVGHENATHFYVMQLIDGQSLAELMARQQHSRSPDRDGASSLEMPDQPNEASRQTETSPGHAAFTHHDGSAEKFRQLARLFAPIADALEHAHETGIVHRDVKPSNLLLDHAGKLWLTDFGLAMRADGQALTMTGDVVGTLKYMSPEQILGNRSTVDHRSDVYSLGLSLYELLAQRPAFPATRRAALMQQISHAAPQPLRSVNRFLPKDLCTIVEKAIAREPQDRYQTAAAFAEDLRRFAAGSQVTARRPTLKRRLTLWAQRHYKAVTIGVVTGLLMLAGLTVGNIALAAEQRRTQTALADSRELLQEYHTTLRDVSSVINRHQLYDQPVYAAMIGDFADALSTHSRILQQLAQDNPVVRRSLLDHLRSVAVASWKSGDQPTARRLYQQVRWLAERSVLHSRKQLDQKATRTTVNAWLAAMEALGNAERYAEFDDTDGRERFDQAIALARKRLPADPDGASLRYWLGFLQAERVRLYAVDPQARMAGFRNAADNLRRSEELKASAVTRRRLARVLKQIHAPRFREEKYETARVAVEEEVRLLADNCAEDFSIGDVQMYCDALRRLITTTLRCRQPQRAADVNDELLRTARRGFEQFRTDEMRQHLARACTHRLRDIGMGNRTMDDPSILMREARRLFHRAQDRQQLVDLTVISAMVVSRLLPDDTKPVSVRLQAFADLQHTAGLADDFRADSAVSHDDGAIMLQRMRDHNADLKKLLGRQKTSP
ncbi:MAG: serine/threonine protein kinase [Planctomycetaceae bacterium]|nr:serine/threonine protein kinase [Planctomycetaceae bacterium]